MNVNTATASTAVEESGSRTTSISSTGSTSKSPTKSAKGMGVEEGELATVMTSTSHPAYRILVIGQGGSGKSSLIGQFITSEHRNTFADEIEEPKENSVSINIGGHECDLSFAEADPQLDPAWAEQEVEAYLLVYSIDRKSSFRTVTRVLETIRERRRAVPVILAGNKADLERRRAVAAHEVKCLALTYDISHFEISVALNHDVDDLLVGIVAEIKESLVKEKENNGKNGNTPTLIGVHTPEISFYFQRSNNSI